MSRYIFSKSFSICAFIPRQICPTFIPCGCWLIVCCYLPTLHICSNCLNFIYEYYYFLYFVSSYGLIVNNVIGVCRLYIKNTMLTLQDSKIAWFGLTFPCDQKKHKNGQLIPLRIYPMKSGSKNQHMLELSVQK